MTVRQSQNHGAEIYDNRASCWVIAIMGIALAAAGFTHGYFEMLQGNVATGGLEINSIGPDHVT